MSEITPAAPEAAPSAAPEMAFPVVPPKPETPVSAVRVGPTITIVPKVAPKPVRYKNLTHQRQAEDIARQRKASGKPI